jgi:small nuclear ribonucleoprotein (snRNP)-like protein
MKVISFSLAVVLVLQGLAYSQDLQAAVELGAQEAKVKAEVTKRGVGQSRVRVSLRDGTEVKGYISEVDDSSFALTDQKSGTVTTISYADVSKIKRQGLSKPVKILTICGVVVGALFGIGAALGRNNG